MLQNFHFEMFIYGCSAVGIPAALKEETTSSALLHLPSCDAVACCMLSGQAGMDDVSFPLMFCWLVNNLPRVLVDFCHILEVLIWQQTEYFCWYLKRWLCHISFLWCWTTACTRVGSRMPQQDCSAAVIIDCNEELAAVPSAPAVP